MKNVLETVRMIDISLTSTEQHAKMVSFNVKKEQRICHGGSPEPDALSKKRAFYRKSFSHGNFETLTFFL